MSECTGVIIKEDSFNIENKNLIPLLERAEDKVDINNVYVKEVSSRSLQKINGDVVVKFIKKPRMGDTIVEATTLTKEVLSASNNDYLVWNFAHSLRDVKHRHYEHNGKELEFKENTYYIVIDGYRVSAQCNNCHEEIQFSRARDIGSEHLLKTDSMCEFPVHGIHENDVISEYPVIIIALARVYESCRCKNV